MTEAYCCPYCNSLFPRDQATVSERGPICPRCGELLPAAQTEPRQRRQGVTAAPSVPRAPEPAKRRPSNLVLGLAVFLVMLGMGWLGLELALRTIDFRRNNDVKKPPVVAAPTGLPGKWSGLGYLPAGTHVFAGIDVADPAAEKLLAEPRPMMLDIALGQIESLSGLKLVDIDQIIVGATIKVKDKSLPITVVVTTRKPYVAEELAKKLKADKIGEHRGKPVYAVQSLLSARLWCPEDQILVLAVRLDGLKKNDLDELPYPPRQGSDGLDKDLQAIWGQPAYKNSPAWIVGQVDGGSLMGLFQGQMPGAAKEVEPLTQVKLFGLIVNVDKEEVRLNGELFAANDAGRLALQKRFESWAKEDAKLIFSPPPPEAQGLDALRVSMQRRFTLEEFRKMMNVSGFTTGRKGK